MLKKIKKYSVFFKYIISAGISFAIDLTLFKLFLMLLKLNVESYSIFLATFFARTSSSLINYLLNRNKVFKNKKSKSWDKTTLIKYTSLVIINMIASATSVNLIHSLVNLKPEIIKIPVDVTLFIINFFIQKYFIFKGSDSYEK